MKRRLFTILAALSLLLCVAAALNWVRSVWVADIIYHSSSDSRTRVWVVSTRGRFGLVMAHFQTPPTSMSDSWTSHDAERVSSNPNDPGWKYLGFDAVVESNARYRQITLGLPYWFIVGVFAILPVFWLRRWRRLRRAFRQGLCLTCGYDLRASKERCPECGTAIAPATGLRP